MVHSLAMIFLALHVSSPLQTLLFIPHKSMLSNCILSMSTTFLPLFLPPLSHFFYSCLPRISTFVCSCPQTGPCLQSLWLAFVCSCVCVCVWNKKWKKISICHTFSTLQRIVCRGVKPSESRLMCQFAQSLFHYFLYFSSCTLSLFKCH